MKCFYHADKDAVAICKSCSRALCTGCAADVHPGTACINRCEQDVEALNVVIERSKTAYQKTGKAYRRNGIVLLITGLVFLFFGALPVFMNGNYGLTFAAVLGSVFLLWSFFSYRNARQIETADRGA